MSIAKLYLVFLKIGFMMIGGAYGGVALFKQVLVDENALITGETFEESISLASSIPGPVTVNAAIMIGYRTGGLIGSIASLLGLLTPSITISFIAVTISYVFRENPWYKVFLRGVILFVIALLAITLTELFSNNVLETRNLGKVLFGVLTVALAIALIKLTKTPVIIVMLIEVGLSTTYYLLTRS